MCGTARFRTTQLQRELSLTGFASDINRQLQELKEIKESMGTFSNDHPHWAQVVKECVSTVEYYFSGDNTALQLCSLGEVVSGMIQELLTRTFEGAIECINKLKILFRIAADKSAFMNLFRSADILINSSWLLLEYGSRAAAGQSADLTSLRLRFSSSALFFMLWLIFLNCSSTFCLTCK